MSASELEKHFEVGIGRREELFSPRVDESELWHAPEGNLAGLHCGRDALWKLVDGDVQLGHWCLTELLGDFPALFEGAAERARQLGRKEFMALFRSIQEVKVPTGGMTGSLTIYARLHGELLAVEYPRNRSQPRVFLSPKNGQVQELTMLPAYAGAWHENPDQSLQDMITNLYSQLARELALPEASELQEIISDHLHPLWSRSESRGWQTLPEYPIERRAWLDPLKNNCDTSQDHQMSSHQIRHPGTPKIGIPVDNSSSWRKPPAK